MAVITRYFSTSGAGAADGTTWANRAPLFDAGPAWSSIIKGFNFSGSDSLLCLIGPGTYSCGTDSLTNGDFTNAPTIFNKLVMHGCDSSGVALSQPDPDWTADQLTWDASGLPLFSSSNTTSFVSLANCLLRLIAFENSGLTTGGCLGTSSYGADWCHFTNSSSNSSTYGLPSGVWTNCVVKMTGTAYSYALNTTNAFNVRVEGNASATSGNRNGVALSSSANLFRVVSINHVGDGCNDSGTSTGVTLRILNCIFANNGGTGLKMPNITGTPAVIAVIQNCMITGNGAYGFDGNTNLMPNFARNNRLRDNTSGNFTNTGNNLTTEVNYTTDSDDASEYVDAANGDFRIKASATIAPMGFGVSLAKPTVAS